MVKRKETWTRKLPLDDQLKRTMPAATTLVKHSRRRGSLLYDFHLASFSQLEWASPKLSSVNFEPTTVICQKILWALDSPLAYGSEAQSNYQSTFASSHSFCGSASFTCCVPLGVA